MENWETITFIWECTDTECARIEGVLLIVQYIVLTLEGLILEVCNYEV